MLCIPLGHAGTLGSARWLIWLLRVYSPGENSATREISLNISRPTRVSVAVTVFEWKFVCGAYQLMDYHLDFSIHAFIFQKVEQKRFH